MKRRRTEQREERRKEQVELNLLAEDEAGRRPLVDRARGCTLPFLGGVLFVLAMVGWKGFLG